MAMHSLNSSDALQQLTAVIASGLPGPKDGVRPLVEALFGGRYQKRHLEKGMIRDAYALAADDGDGVPYAGLVNPDNAGSGPYGGTSVVWMPTKDNGSMISFVVGTKGLSPDEGILTRPGHRRRIAALRRHLSRLGVDVWTKPDPSALGVRVPAEVQRRFRGFEHAFKRYGQEFYCVAAVPRDDDEKALAVVSTFVDLYALERGWQALKSFETEFDEVRSSLTGDLFPTIDATTVDGLLRSRRFVILQGPPGTGKTRLADEVGRTRFDGRFMSVQFHPAVTYEDFIVGLSPNPVDSGLQFRVRPGWLIEAAHQAGDGPFLLIVDEVNRADLGKVLGEAIYLFEAGEVGGDRARAITLPHPVNGEHSFRIPPNLYVLATMNTADRSIAGIDLAVRRRFAFVTMMPDRRAVASQGLALATEMFDRLLNVFVEHAPDETLDLLPGHSYFLGASEAAVVERFRYELVPLLDEYLRQGFLGPATTELHAVRDAIDDAVTGYGPHS